MRHVFRELVVALVMVSVVGAAPVARASRSIPIQMSGSIADSPTPDLACRGLHNVSTGAIEGSPFGVSKWSSDGCIDVTAEPGVLTIRDATFVLTARGGKVYGAYHAHASAPSSSGHIYAWGPFTITKGTGRYAGAHGSGIAASDGNIIARNAQLYLSGSMTAPHA